MFGVNKPFERHREVFTKHRILSTQTRGEKIFSLLVFPTDFSYLQNVKCCCGWKCE